MKKISLIVGVAIIIGLGIFTISNVRKDSGSTLGKISIVTTLFPQYDFAKIIGKDMVDVKLLLPPGVEAHSYEPKPSDITRINNSKIFVYTGESMEPWAHDIIEGIDKKVKVVDVSVGVEMMKEETDDGYHHEHVEKHHLWEWAGAFKLGKGEYTWTFSKVNGVYADPKMKMVILPSESDGVDSMETVEEFAEKMFVLKGIQKQNSGILTPNANYELIFDDTKNVTSYKISIEKAGVYVFFTEHMPFEFEANEHFFKNKSLVDVKPFAQEPESVGHSHHHHGGVDPHIWLDFDNAKIMAENVTKALSQVDPQNTKYYQDNLKTYQNKLTELDNVYKNTLLACKSKKIVYGGHYAFGYMAKRYGLEYVSAQGFSPDAEPTAKDMIDLVKQVKENNISHIFYEELTSPKIAQTLARETNTKLLLLNGAHNIAKKDYELDVSFISIMEENLRNLSVGLDCKK